MSLCHDNKHRFALAYVDDLLAPSKTTDDFDWMFKQLSQQVLLKHTGNLTAGTTVKFLGRRLVHRGTDVLIKPLDSYCNDLLKAYNLENCKPVTSTGNSASKLTGEAADALSTDDHSKYRTAIGKLQWLATIRTDLLFPAKELARGTNCRASTTTEATTEIHQRYH